MIAALPAREPLDVCGDCGVHAGHGVIILPLRKPGGWWAVCSVCFRASLKNAEEDRRAREAKLARLEGKQRKTHLRKRVGSHDVELTEEQDRQDEIFLWGEGAA